MNGKPQQDRSAQPRGAARGGQGKEPLEGAKIARLGEFRVDFETWEISRNGHRERLREKPFRVLEALTERPGELVTRSELQQRLWPDGTVVDFDNNLNSAVASLRTLLGDTAKAPWVIETLPRLGYRLIAEVQFEGVDDTSELREATHREASPATELLQESPPRRSVDSGRRPERLPLARLAALVVLLFVALWVGVRERFLAPAVSFAVGDESVLVEPVSVEPAPAGDPVPKHPAAQRAWQQGQYLLARGSAGDLTKALESFEEARRLEPRFAPTHVAIAETLVRTSFAGGLELGEGLVRAREAARRALALDPASADGHRLVALADLHLDWDFEASGAGIAAALQLAPGEASNHLAAATFLSAAGANDAAVRAARRAVELDPASTLLRADLGFFLLAAGRYSEALDLSEELLEIEPESIHVLGTLVTAAERLGRFDRAVAAAQRVLELRGAGEPEIRVLDGGDARTSLIHYRKWRLASFRASGEPSPLRLAVHLAGLQEREAALAALHRAREQRDPWMVYLHSFDALANLRGDPQFHALVRQLGFPPPADAVVARVTDLL